MFNNLLETAMSIVGTQNFMYKKFLSREQNNIGIFNSNYETPILIYGQAQAVPRQLYESYGLSFQKDYLMFYISADIMDVSRNISGDIIIYNNKEYQCLSLTNWHPINGWVNVLAVAI